MPTFNNTIPKFRATFDKTNLVMNLLDLVQTAYASYGTLANFKGIFQVKDPDGTIVYQGTGFSTTAPAWTTPDTNGATPTWTVLGISLPDGFKLGVWTFNYVCTMDGGTHITLVTKTYNFQYVSPTVVIGHEVHCDDSLLYSENLTDSVINIGGNTFSPSPYALQHTVTPPSDSGVSPLPGTTADELRLIGGGNTNPTRLWTNTWQTDIEIDLGYNLANWTSTTTPWIVIIDNIKGHKGVEVVCEACDCTLLQCYLNLIGRYDDAEKGHRRGAYELRDKVTMATSLMVAYSKELECGADTTQTCNDLSVLLANDDCSCGQPASDSSVPVIQRSYRTSTGGGVGSCVPFNFTFVDNPPPGNAGDVNWNPVTNEISQYLNGQWVVQYTITTIQGLPGADGADGTGSSVLWNDMGASATGNSTSKTPLKVYTLAPGVMANDEDLLKIKALYQFALNANGKEISLDFGTDETVNYFTDALITDPFFVLETDVSRKTAATQFIESRTVATDEITVTTTAGTQSLANPVTITAYGTNSVASAADITCKQLEILYFSLVGGVNVLVTNLKTGTEVLTGMVAKTVVFLTAFPLGSTYTLNIYCLDGSGNAQQTNVTPGSEDESGFEVTCAVDSVMYYTAIKI